MGSKLIVFDTSETDASGKPKGTVKLRGFTPANGTWEDVDQEENDNTKRKVSVTLKGNARCEFHRRKAVAAGHPPTPGNRKTLLLRLHAKDGIFQAIKVKARPKTRKKGDEFEPAFHQSKFKRKLKVVRDPISRKPTELIYRIVRRVPLGEDERLKITIKANA